VATAFARLTADHAVLGLGHGQPSSMRPGAKAISSSASSVPTSSELVASRRDEWLGTGRPILPLMVLPDGNVSRGLEALARPTDLLGT
jgi:hypothetical protein